MLHPVSSVRWVIALSLCCICCSPSLWPAVCGLRTFSFSLSQGYVSTSPSTLLERRLDSGVSHAVLHHLWVATNPADIADVVVFQYFLDGERLRPSLNFTMSQAAGVMFRNASLGPPAALQVRPPWSTDWMGQNAAESGWFHTFPIPFYRSCRIAAYLPEGLGLSKVEVWIIIRATEGMPLVVGGLPLPLSQQPRLQLQRIDELPVQPHDFVTFASVPRGHSGLLLLHSLHAVSAVRDFFEGCYHSYDPYTDAPLNSTHWPGDIVSTGMEDYFLSAYGFTAGVFAGHNSGLTYFACNPASIANCSISAYRFHDRDPIFFEDGFRFMWRIGERLDSEGRKCTSIEGPSYGNPQLTIVSSYTWLYVWPNPGAE
jgi:hypothetical protein